MNSPYIKLELLWAKEIIPQVVQIIHLIDSAQPAALVRQPLLQQIDSQAKDLAPGGAEDALQADGHDRHLFPRFCKHGDGELIGLSCRRP